MKYNKQQLWARFKKYYTEFPQIGLAVDLSRMNFEDGFFASMEPRIQKAFLAMDELENGAIANPDENRMVGHYWLRNSQLAPTDSIRLEIETTVTSIKAFVADVHSGKIVGAAGPFKHLLVIGIGGSALGPQFLAKALGDAAEDEMNLHFFDNTDPDGMDSTLANLEAQPNGRLGQTLTIVISKSGGTKETRNGMLEAKAAYDRAGLQFERHAVAITGNGSELHTVSVKDNWITRFPMWDWVGGRTSVLSAVGLLPAALQGINIDDLLKGAKTCDEITRRHTTMANPAALMALMWFHSGNGKGLKDMVVLPYKDRFELFSKYLQQLIMESLGKELDLNGNIVNQGIAVYGNKGSTDQHAYMQQLRDGVNNYFATFIEILKDRAQPDMEVEPNITSGDYLNSFLLGSRTALNENGRESITLTVPDTTPHTAGVLIALYERTVGLYASLININAYHQPGVEAGKRSATAVLSLQIRSLQYLTDNPGAACTSEQLAGAIGVADDAEMIFKIMEHLAANSHRGIVKTPGENPFAATYSFNRH